MTAVDIANKNKKLLLECCERELVQANYSRKPEIKYYLRDSDNLLYMINTQIPLFDVGKKYHIEIKEI